jgi:hypothetical protein
MPGNPGLRLEIAQACVFALLFVGWSSAGTENLPVTSAETLAGQKVEFPAALAGKPAVCVFGFSKEAGDRIKVWMNRLTQDGINAWSVANLEGAPVLVRGMIRSSMRKGTPQAQLAHSLVMTKDAKVWKLAVGAKQDNLPTVVVFDSTAQMQWKYEGLFGDEAYRELKTRLERAMQGLRP